MLQAFRPACSKLEHGSERRAANFKMTHNIRRMLFALFRLVNKGPLEGISFSAPAVYARQNPARKPIETAQPRGMVALIEASSYKSL